MCYQLENKVDCFEIKIISPYLTKQPGLFPLARKVHLYFYLLCFNELAPCGKGFPYELAGVYIKDVEVTLFLITCQLFRA